MSCAKSGECSEDKSTWCNGYTCQQGTITQDKIKRTNGQMCNKSSDCSTSYCEKPDCNVLSSLGVSPETCSRMGVCTVKP